MNFCAALFVVCVMIKRLVFIEASAAACDSHAMSCQIPEGMIAVLGGFLATALAVFLFTVYTDEINIR